MVFRNAYKIHFLYCRAGLKPAPTSWRENERLFLLFNRDARPVPAFQIAGIYRFNRHNRAFLNTR